MHALNGALNALVRVDAAEALRAAGRLDEAVRHGRPVGPLAGVPFVVKDNIDVHGQETASGSRAHHGVVAMADAPVVRHLREAGAILLGRANMDELAMGASTQTSSHGPTRNPVDRRRSPGGSSGGSAAAVAAGFVPLAVGTDTGGSIREPASQCGVVGMAPSDGLVSLDGVIPFAPGLDRVGPLARSAADTAAMLAVMSGRPLDPVETRSGGSRSSRSWSAPATAPRCWPPSRRGSHGCGSSAWRSPRCRFPTRPTPWRRT